MLGLSKKALSGTAPFSAIELVQTKRVQLPQKTKFLIRIIFYMRLDSQSDQAVNKKKSKSKSNSQNNVNCFCKASGSPKPNMKNNNSINWVTKAELLMPALADKIWGLEVNELTERVLKTPANEVPPWSVEEFTLEDLYQYSPREPPRSSEEHLLLELNFNEKILNSLFGDFLEHCWPCFAMPPGSFKRYLRNYGFRSSDTRHRALFRAFAFYKSGSICFHELMIGLACLEPLSVHHDTRIKFIFRFYDNKSKGCLDVKTDFRRLLVDLESGHAPVKDGKKKKKIKIPAEKVEKVARSVGISIQGPGNPPKQIISFGNFKSAILDSPKRLNGTHVLCRSAVPVFYQLIQAFICRKRETADDTVHWANIGRDSSLLIKRCHGKYHCRRCQETKFRLATHAITFDRKGYPFAQKLVTGSSSSKDGLSVQKSTDTSALAANSSPSSATNTGNLNPTSTLDDRSLEILFNSDHIANVMIRMVRKFSKCKGTVHQSRGLMGGSAAEQKKMAQLVVELIAEAKKIASVPSIVRNGWPLYEEGGNESGGTCQLATVQAPCYVIGDIHGNIEDLLTLERCIWPSAPVMPFSLLFLGDYVDRGKWSLECALYLIALRLLAPEKVTLLRGNHEVRALQEKYSFKAECYRKYGPKHGDTIWAAVNDLFDTLPVAATIEEAIFAVHGGLSPNAPTLAAIRSLPSSMSDPETESPIAWELLWSDPCHMQQYLDVMDANELSSAPFVKDGFVTNFKRGAAYLFNERAASAFLTRNRLTHMIRAHEPPPLGYAHHAKNLVTTVFSCSHYCGNDNAAAVILIESNQIRPVHVDTFNNAPATEQG